MKRITITLLLIVAIFASCKTEEYINVSRKFYKTNDSLALLVLRPDNILFSNHKIYDSVTVDTNDFAAKQKFLIEQSDFLKYLDEEIVNKVFVDNFIQALSNTNLNVYTVEYIDEFKKNPQNCRFVADLQQLEFDEFFNVKTDKYEDVRANLKGGYDTTIFIHDTYVNTFGANVWLDFYSPFSDTASLLFANNTISDFHNGKFYLNAYNEVVYIEDNAELSPFYISYFLQLIAERYATYMYDYVLNTCLQTNYKEVVTYPDSLSLHFTPNLVGGKVELVGDDMRFIELAK